MKDINFKVNNTTINIREIGKLKAFDNKIKVYCFLIECDRGEESINFIFHNSIAFTEELDNNKRKYTSYSLTEEERRSLISSVLSCIEMDYNAEGENLRSFMDAYGYEYSEETEIIFNKVTEQKLKLRKVFDIKDIEMLTENDDILKNFVEKLEYKRI